jgi:hypothetical protein
MWIQNTDNRDVEASSIGIHLLKANGEIDRIRIPHNGTADQVKEATQLATQLTAFLNQKGK